MRKNILIVGGAGKMGRRFADAFSARGHSLSCLDLNDDPLSIDYSLIDIALVSVPMQQAVTVANEVCQKLSANTLICDINSLKSEICTLYKKYPKLESVGLHPMCGPTIDSFRAQKMIWCEVNAAAHASWLKDELKALGFDLVECDPERHDKMMAIVQVLAHFSSMVVAKTLTKSGTSLEDTLQFISPIYKLELSIVARLFAQDAELYAEILQSNSWGKEIRQVFLAAFNEIDKLVDSGQRESFCEEFVKIGQYFSEFKDEAMEYTDRVIKNN